MSPNKWKIWHGSHFHIQSSNIQVLTHRFTSYTSSGNSAKYNNSGSHEGCISKIHDLLNQWGTGRERKSPAWAHHCLSLGVTSSLSLWPAQHMALPCSRGLEKYRLPVPGGQQIKSIVTSQTVHSTVMGNRLYHFDPVSVKCLGNSHLWVAWCELWVSSPVLRLASWLLPRASRQSQLKFWKWIMHGVMLFSGNERCIL